MISKNFEAFSQNKSLINSIQDNLPELKRYFKELQKLTTQPGSQATFDIAINAFYRIFDCVPLPGPYIDSYEMPFFRARPNNKKNVLFSKITDISYNGTNPKAISEGRFNQRGEAVFYASLPVENDAAKSSLAACLETCKGLTSERNPVKLKDFTIGRWKIIKPFYVINFCFDDEHLKGNPSLKRQTEEYINLLRKCLNEESSNFILEFLTYFSELSGRKSEEKYEYYILIAMFYAIRIYYEKKLDINILGLIYPSAMTEKKGLNIVLTTEAVDQHLKLDKVGMYRFFLDGKTYHADPCCEAVDIVDDGFTITGFRRIPENKWYTIECEPSYGTQLLESKD